MSNDDLPDTPFWNQFRGKFSGVLKWHDMDTLWAELKSTPANWYVYNPVSQAPVTVLGEQDFLDFLNEAVRLINQRRNKPNCGLIYVDDFQQPTYIKIFDPANMGSSCSCSTSIPMPRWIVSKLAPDTLPPSSPAKKSTLFSHLVGRA